MHLIRSFLARDGGARRLLRRTGSIASTGEIDRGPSNPAAVLQSSEQNGQPGEAGSAVSTEAADRLRDARQYERAAEAYAAALEQAPLRTDIRVQHGNMLKDSGRLDEAEVAYRAALAQAPDDADIYLQLARTLKAQCRRAAAIDAYRRAAELAPLATEPMRDLALLEAINDPVAIVDIGCGSRLRMLSLGDDVVAETYRNSGPRSFEPASLIVWFQLARQSSYAIDVGAFTGIYALVAADANQLIKVAAVEPTRQVFPRLCLNIKSNGFQTRIAPLNFAAGDRLGDCLLNHYGDGLDCGSTLLESGDSPFWYSETARMLPLDRLSAVAAADRRGGTLIELPQTGPDIVKIDVEGYELAVLAGMRQAISSSQPIFIIECLSLDALRAVHDYLAEFTYRPLLIDDENMSLLGDVREYRWETTRNIMFYPHGKQHIIDQMQNDSGVAIRL